MDPNNRVLPPHRLPPGFPEAFEVRPAPPVTPRPAATLLLLRGGPAGLEALLLRRSPRAGFIPGAYVFPGGQVDLADGEPDLLARFQGLTEARARVLLGRTEDNHPALAFWVAALRETFEETGVFFGRDSGGRPPSDGNRVSTSTDSGERLASARSLLLSGEATFLEVLESLDLAMDGTDVRYIGHWITPECEARRFDTRFFGACVPTNCPVEVHPSEMVEALWLPPSEALDRNRAGRLPLVFPTLRTLEEVEDFADPREALESLAGRAIAPLLPRLSRAEGGIRFVVDR